MKLVLLICLLLSGMNAAAQPALKGGLDRFITANKRYPAYSSQNCIQGTVTISFKLNKAGEVYFSRVQKGVGTDLDDEALRLIRMSTGKWTVPSTHDTTVFLVAPINFKLDSETCRNRSKAEIRQAIDAYQGRMGLTNAILNFYKKKPGGNFTKDEEDRILALKSSLGYDDEYLQQRIELGKDKLKHKDQQGACEDFQFVKYMGSNLADELLQAYCN